MTALGFLYPGHSAENDYPRIEQLLGSDIRVDLMHTEAGADAHRVDSLDATALRELGSPERLTPGCASLRLTGAEAVVWACAGASFALGHDGARNQIRALAQAAGMPASSTAFAFVHAAREINAARVAVASTYQEEVAALFATFLGEAGIEVTEPRPTPEPTPPDPATWTADDILTFARAADTPDAEAILLPDTALHTAAHIPTLENHLAKPVLTAAQVTVWEALRLTDRRVNAPELGALFTREPLVQV